MLSRFALVLALASCSSEVPPAAIDAASDDARAIDAARHDVPPGAFTLTSPVLAAGGAIAVANACAGANTSPQLEWAGAPGAASFAVVLTDKSNNLIHAVIYDIPMTATGLPTGVEKAYAPANVAGAHQTLAYDDTTRGYLGPCPPNTHTYEFAVYALDTAALPTATMATMRAQAMSLIGQHMIAKATLTGTYTP